MLTYRRPLDLAQAMPRLAAEAKTVRGCRVVIVDNAPDASARPMFEELRQALSGTDFTYVHESEPGITAARNRALDSCPDDDVLVFIDDDERPTDGWLGTLLNAYDRYDRPAAVVGPVVSEFAVEPPVWIQAGRFFDRRRHCTGDQVGVAATNNLLLDLHQVRDLGIRFDPRYATSGGEDALFTRQLARGGARLVWCDEAAVVDVVPASRLTRRWVLQKAFRIANGTGRVDLELSSDRRRRSLTRARLLGRGGARLAVGAAQATAGAVTGRLDVRARGVRLTARGAGFATSAFGYVYSEYARTQGSGRRSALARHVRRAHP